MLTNQVSPRDGRQSSEIVITRNRCPAERQKVGLAAIETQRGGFGHTNTGDCASWANRF